MSREVLVLPPAAPMAPPPGFSASLAALNVALDAAQLDRMARYLGLLVAMNELVNLTRITAPEDAWTRHVLDALSLVPHLASLPAGARVLDVGSGGGVPGIPLAIARPDLRVSLLEATHKKADFLRAASAELGLQVEVHAERAEKLASTSLAGTFDVVTARAVAAIETLLGWTAPFAKPGGALLLIKGEKAPDELRAAKSALKKHRCTHEHTVTTPTGRVVVLRAS